MFSINTNEAAFCLDFSNDLSSTYGVLGTLANAFPTFICKIMLWSGDYYNLSTDDNWRQESLSNLLKAIQGRKRVSLTTEPLCCTKETHCYKLDLCQSLLWNIIKIQILRPLPRTGARALESALRQTTDNFHAHPSGIHKPAGCGPVGRSWLHETIVIFYL